MPRPGAYKLACSSRSRYALPVRLELRSGEEPRPGEQPVHRSIDQQVSPVPYSMSPEIVTDAPAEEYSRSAHVAPCPFEEGKGLLVVLWIPRGRIKGPLFLRANVGAEA